MQTPHFSSKKEPTKLAPDIQSHVDAFVAFVIDERKRGYNNPLVPFSQHAAEIRAEVQASLNDLQRHLENAYKVLKGQFEKQESQRVTEPENSSFSLFENAYAELRTKMQAGALAIPELLQSGPIQEQMKLPWAFMDRAYTIAKHLLDEKNYEDAEATFLFLQILHPDVFEYWVGHASALQAQGKLEEATRSYIASLRLQPTNASIFFQIASCFCQAHEIPSSLKALELCIEHAQNDPQQKALVDEAKEAKAALVMRAA